MAGLHLKLNLPEEIIEKYEKDGPLDKVFSEHLKRTADYKALKPIYINDALRQRLEKFFGINFNSPLELVKVIEKFSTIRVGDFNLQIPPSLMGRLRSRHFNVNETFEQFLSKKIIQGLEEFAGMR